MRYMLETHDYIRETLTHILEDAIMNTSRYLF